MADRIFVILKPGPSYPRKRRVLPHYGLPTLPHEDPVPSLTNLVKEVNAAGLAKLFAGPAGVAGVDPRRIDSFEFDRDRATRRGLELVVEWHRQKAAMLADIEG